MLSTPSVKVGEVPDARKKYSEDMGALQLEQLRLEKKHLELEQANYNKVVQSP